MSYETYSLQDNVWVFDMSADDGLDNNYQLDGGLYTATIGYSKAANVFQVSKKDGVDSETLKSLYHVHRQLMWDTQLKYIQT